MQSCSIKNKAGIDRKRGKQEQGRATPETPQTAAGGEGQTPDHRSKVTLIKNSYFEAYNTTFLDPAGRHAAATLVVRLDRWKQKKLACLCAPTASAAGGHPAPALATSRSGPAHANFHEQ